MSDDYDAAKAQLSRKLATSAMEIMSAAFRLSGFDCQRRERRAEIARQCRLMAARKRDRPDDDDNAAEIASVICAVFDTFSHGYDPAEVRAAVALLAGGPA